MNAVATEQQGVVLVLDAENRSSLAVIRSLGRAGLRVIAASHLDQAIGTASKYVSQVCSYSSPSKNSEKFVEDLLALVKKHKPQMLLPCSDLSLELILSKENEFRALTCLPFSDQGTINNIINKDKILEIANNCGIETPHTVESQTKPNLESFPFPAVVKASKSFSKGSEGFSKPAVCYANNSIELKNILESFSGPALIQQRIIGPGVGVFTLSRAGKVLSVFCHKRLLEKPPTGGVSVLSESIFESEAPVAQAIKLIEALKLDGIAMLEFKQGTDGKFYLMEINPRFWGSLQLAISAGRDFPLMLYNSFINNDSTNKQRPYLVGLRLRWFLGTLDHLIIRLKKDGPAKVLSYNALMLFQEIGRTKYDVFDANDIKPFLRELKNYL